MGEGGGRGESGVPDLRRPLAGDVQPKGHAAIIVAGLSCLQDTQHITRATSPRRRNSSRQGLVFCLPHPSPQASW